MISAWELIKARVARLSTDAVTGGNIILSGSRTVGVNVGYPIAIGILGQSNERGQVPGSDEAAYPQAFNSLRNPAVMYPLPGTNTTNGFPYRRSGGMWCKFYDDMFDYGYDCRFFNGSVGSFSLVRDVCGQIPSSKRSNSTAYYAQRGVSGYDDRGYSGDLTLEGATPSKLMRCTTGNNAYAFYSGPTPPGGLATPARFQNIRKAGSLLSAGSSPGDAAFDALSVGGTIADGSLTWTCVATAGFTAGQVLSESQDGYGFDPYQILERLHENMQAIQGVSQRWILINQAQGDIGTSAANYSSALQAIATYFARRGYQVAIGLSCYQANVNNTAAYNNLQSGMTTALSTLQGTPPAGTAASQFHAGANLYALMGSSGNMANGGAYFQADNIHLNGLGAIAAGGFLAAAMQALLPPMA